MKPLRNSRPAALPYPISADTVDAAEDERDVALRSRRGLKEVRTGWEVLLTISATDRPDQLARRVAA